MKLQAGQSRLKAFRRHLRDGERDSLMLAYYRPHHARLEAAVSAAIDRHARCLVIDRQSFPSFALPYEFADPAVARPDICIGTDVVHNSGELAIAFVAAFEREGSGVDLSARHASPPQASLSCCHAFIARIVRAECSPACVFWRAIW